MKRNCQVCGVEYNPHDFAAFFYMQYCSERCEGQVTAEARAVKAGIHTYMCIQPLQIILVDADNNEQYEGSIQVHSKWRRDETQSRGLNAVHLVNLSGIEDEPVAWLEIDEEALKKHFERY